MTHLIRFAHRITLSPCHPVTLSVAQIVPCTEAEGPGRRFALWFQGCPLRCAGCCNPEMLPFAGGQQIPLADVLVQVRRAASEQGVEGITLLGGEPIAHASLKCRPHDCIPRDSVFLH